MTDCCDDGHPDHSGEISRLNRIAGQIEGVRKMIEERRYCPEILTQLRAVRSATRALEANILEAHLGACVAEAMLSEEDSKKQQKIDELVDLFKRFEA